MGAREKNNTGWYQKVHGKNNRGFLQIPMTIANENMVMELSTAYQVLTVIFTQDLLSDFTLF